MDNFWNDIEQLWRQQDKDLQGRHLSREQLQQLIEAAEERQHSRRRSRRLVAAAACLLMLLGTAFYFSMQEPRPALSQQYASATTAPDAIMKEDTVASILQTIVKDTIKRMQRASITSPTPQLMAAATVPDMELMQHPMDSAAPLAQHNIDSVKETAPSSHSIRYLCNHQCTLADLEQQASTLIAMI